MTPDVNVIEKTPICLQHTFNGTLIAHCKDKNTYSHVIDDISTCKLINIYRNSSTPAPPCNTSVKEITTAGKIADPTSTKHIYINEYKEDPRVFTFKDQLYISYNKVHLDTKGYVTDVKVFYSRLNKDLTPDPEELTFPIPTNLWEKNWLFFEYNNELCMIYSIYPLRIYNSIGRVIKDMDWIHPYDKAVQADNITRRFLNKNISDLKQFTKASSLFYKQGFTFDIRGGAPPVYLEGMYYLFAHSREMPGAKYDMIVVVLDSNLNIYGATNPFKIHDACVRIVYPAGAIYDRKTSTWYISCGIDDINQSLISMTHEFLKSKIICIK
jgi:hypothetical protein